jgi:hypothetical protein
MAGGPTEVAGRGGRDRGRGVHVGVGVAIGPSGCLESGQIGC